MARLSVRWMFAACGVALLAPFAACSQTTETPDSTGQSSTSLEKKSLPDRFERMLAWGKGEGELTLRPAQTESVAYGPNAVAALPTGEAAILDRLAGRVLVVDDASAPRIAASVPVDAEDLVAGPDGALVAFSPLRARAWFFEPSGAAAGEMTVPRELRDLMSLSLGTSRRLTVRTGYQESLVLGSPSAPLPLEVTLAGKREGAFLLPDGRGVAVRATEQGARLVVVSQAADEAARSQIVLAHPIPGSVTAARIIGGQGSTVCLRTELVTGNPEVSVERRAVCMDALSGAVSIDEPLPKPGLYVPRSELAFGAGRLCFIHPTKDGLTLRSWRVAAAQEVQP